MSACPQCERPDAELLFNPSEQLWACPCGASGHTDQLLPGDPPPEATT